MRIKKVFCLVAIALTILSINFISATTSVLLYGNYSETGFIHNNSNSYSIQNYSDIIIGCNGACSSWNSRGFSFFGADSIDNQNSKVIILSSSLILNITSTNIESNNLIMYDVDEDNWSLVSNYSKFIDIGSGNNYSNDLTWGQSTGLHTVILNDIAKSDIANSINNKGKFALSIKGNESADSSYLNINRDSVLLNVTYVIAPLTIASGNYSDTGEVYYLGSYADRAVNITLNCIPKGDSSNCINTTYCIDTTNTCTPSINYTLPFTVSTSGYSYIRYRSIDNQNNIEDIKSQLINQGAIPSPIVWPQCNPADSCCNSTGYFKPSGSICKNAYNAVCNSINSTSCSGQAYVDKCNGFSSSCPITSDLINYPQACDDLVCVNQSCSGSTLQPQRTCSSGVCQQNDQYDCPNNLICLDSVNCKKNANSSSDCKNGFSYDNNSKVCYKQSNYVYDLRYDANGNLISIFGNEFGLGWQYIYNDFNQLFQVKDEGVTVIAENYYDESGTRIKRVEYDGVQSTTIFYYDNFVQVINDSGTYNETYYYFYNTLVGKRDNAGNKLFYHSNNLGSTSLITNSSGGVVEDLSYEPFGFLNNSNSSQRYTYTGHENEPLDSLLYMGARYYNPELGQFIQPDQITFNAFNSRDLNSYTYARNNPYYYIDQNGKWVETVIDLAFIGYDISQLRTSEGRKDWVNWVSLGADVVCAILPIATGGGEAVRGGTKLVEEGTKFAEGSAKVDKIKDLGEISEKAQEVLTKSEGKIMPYSEAKKLTAGFGGEIQAHKLVEARQLKSWGEASKIPSAPSIILSKSQHQKITNLLRTEMPYTKGGKDIVKYGKSEVLKAYKNVYQKSSSTSSFYKRITSSIRSIWRSFRR